MSAKIGFAGIEVEEGVRSDTFDISLADLEQSVISKEKQLDDHENMIETLAEQSSAWSESITRQERVEAEAAQKEKAHRIALAHNLEEAEKKLELHEEALQEIVEEAVVKRLKADPEFREWFNANTSYWDALEPVYKRAACVNAEISIILKKQAAQASEKSRGQLADEIKELQEEMESTHKVNASIISTFRHRIVKKREHAINEGLYSNQDKRPGTIVNSIKQCWELLDEMKPDELRKLESERYNNRTQSGEKERTESVLSVELDKAVREGENK